MASRRLSREQRWFKRLVISQGDIEHARGYALEILRLELHEADGVEVRFLHRGLSAAMVVSYCRPFTNNRGGAASPGLPSGILRALSPEQRRLHDRLRALRNQAVAHSDSDAHGVRVNVRAVFGTKVAVPVGWNAHLPLGRQETEDVVAMCDLLRLRISAEQQKLQALFDEGTSF